MAFDLELVRTKVTDWVHTLETDLGPTVERVKEAFAAVLGQVHAQVVADEQTVKNQVIGDVKTVEDDVHAAAAPETAPTVEPGAEPASAPAEAAHLRRVLSREPADAGETSEPEATK